MPLLPTVSVTIRDTSNLDEYEIPFGSINIDDELNVGRSCRVTLEYRAIKDIADKYNVTVEGILSGGKREIIIKKETTNIFIGLVSDFTLARSNEDGMILDIAGVSYFSVLQKRRTDNKRVFTATDAGDIAWTLIDESQQSDLPYSDFGITQGTIDPSTNRDVTYRFADIKQEITNLSNKVVKNGFDFDIDNNKVFNVFFPLKGSQRPDIYMDESNISAWSLRKPLVLSLTNKVYVIGNGFNDDIIYTTRDAPNTYKATFGLLEGIVSARQISEVANLEDIGDKYLLDNQGPQTEIELNHIDGQPDFLDYEVGDEVKVTLPEIALMDDFRRVYRRNIKIDINSVPVVKIIVK